MKFGCGGLIFWWGVGRQICIEYTCRNIGRIRRICNGFFQVFSYNVRLARIFNHYGRFSCPPSIDNVSDWLYTEHDIPGYTKAGQKCSPPLVKHYIATQNILPLSLSVNKIPTLTLLFIQNTISTEAEPVEYWLVSVQTKICSRIVETPFISNSIDISLSLSAVFIFSLDICIYIQISNYFEGKQVSGIYNFHVPGNIFLSTSAFYQWKISIFLLLAFWINKATKSVHNILKI